MEIRSEGSVVAIYDDAGRSRDFICSGSKQKNMYMGYCEPYRTAFEIFGTGHDVVDLDTVDLVRKYLATVQLNDGELILHIFERVAK